MQKKLLVVKKLSIKKKKKNPRHFHTNLNVFKYNNIIIMC
jgi:hypothetical protein